GFNFNNLLQSMVPVRTGNFSSITGRIKVAKGVVGFNELLYRGEDMRLWGAGHANLVDNTMDIEMAGQIPRVASSMFSRTFGEVSRNITFQRMMNFLTMHKLENLPSIPLLGDIASDKPRAFTFKVQGPTDQPKLVARSIEKSFHWLPNQPGAS